MICTSDSLFLFTKEKNRTAVFLIPKTPGSHIARFKSEFKRKNFFATGAWYDLNRQRLVICGYNNRVRTFVYSFSGFSGTDFFSVKPRRYRFSKTFRQTEGIASFDGTHFFMTSEWFKIPPIVNQPAQLYKVFLD